ncbi:MAG: hypothetical protein IAE97_08490 [Chthoniobacterales bacterium]|nr:hypothetical protein [Chthoniobacterales bacterium]
MPLKCSHFKGGAIFWLLLVIAAVLILWSLSRPAITHGFRASPQDHTLDQLSSASETETSAREEMEPMEYYEGGGWNHAREKHEFANGQLVKTEVYDPNGELAFLEFPIYGEDGKIAKRERKLPDGTPCRMTLGLSVPRLSEGLSNWQAIFKRFNVWQGNWIPRARSSKLCSSQIGRLR